uniref:Uncharacterized protein n=1 Tax=Anguilla anguilla TaxID=7936 RepID=A0A0E9WTB8_ANGAN
MMGRFRVPLNFMHQSFQLFILVIYFVLGLLFMKVLFSLKRIVFGGMSGVYQWGRKQAAYD